MNYLAHIYLSGTHTELRFGNFIVDAVPGKEYDICTKGIQDGILLHRAIDTFTDQHTIFRKHGKLLFPDFGHYSRVIVICFKITFWLFCGTTITRKRSKYFPRIFIMKLTSKKSSCPIKSEELFLI